MNLILFREDETGKPLPKRDERTIHLIKVLHKRMGDSFDAGLLNGPLGQGRIIALEPDGSIRVELQLDRPAPERHPLRVAVGFPRPIQLRRLLRDLSSLGVSHIDLLATELGEKSYQDTTLLSDGGAEQALIEGAIQSRDTTLPVLASYPSLRSWLTAKPWEAGKGPSETDVHPVTAGQSVKLAQDANNVQSVNAIQTVNEAQPAVLLLAPDNVRPLGSMAELPCSPGAEAVLVIGSERGWSESERAQLEAAGFLRLSMGSRALRTETACVAAAILALEKIGALR
ncbi:MAG: RsmE family RNA methyltransferase [Treponema sp.]|nr:RsmE family RNA methyltransferase [Treponema sp.]